jgi:hypothetical protein
MLSRKMQQQVMDAARHIDLFLWIDTQKRTRESSKYERRVPSEGRSLFGLPDEGNYTNPSIGQLPTLVQS